MAEIVDIQSKTLSEKLSVLAFSSDEEEVANNCDKAADSDTSKNSGSENASCSTRRLITKNKFAAFAESG